MIEYLYKRVGDRICYHNQTGKVVCSEVTFSEIADSENGSKFWVITEYTVLFDNNESRTFKEYNRWKR